MGRNTIQKRQAVLKLKDTYTKWLKLNKEGQLKPPRKTYTEKKSKFQDYLSLLFNVAPMNTIRTDELRNNTPPQPQPSYQRLYQEDQPLNVEQRHPIARYDYNHLSDSIDDEKEDPLDADFTIRKTIKKKSVGKQKILSHKVCDALDRAKLSGNKAMFVVNSVIEATGQNPSNFVLSKESIRKCRMLRREKLYMEIKNMFGEVENFVVHWDSKACLNAKGEKDEKLSIAVSYDGKTKILDSPIIPDKRGKTQADAVLHALEEWGIKDNVVGMCYDTTRSNTGLNIGACINIQNQMLKNVLHLPCRHHIMELIIGSAFQTCKSLEENTVSEDISIFKDFKGMWKTIDRNHFESALSDGPLMECFTQAEITNVLQFCQHQINVFLPRNDYKEMLQLILTLFGEAHTRGATNVDILAPVSVSRPRWMAKIIYILKIYLFRSQGDLSAEQLSDIRRFVCFVVKLYVYHWYTCPNALTSAQNDLQLFKKLLEYREKDAFIANAALRKFSQHLWYLGELLVGFSFFDPSVSVEIKQKMVNSLRRESRDKHILRFDIGSGSKPGNDDLERLQVMDLSHFVSNQTMIFFDTLNINTEFLSVPPSQWEHSASYTNHINFLRKIHVVNDLADRGVSLAAEYSAIITKDKSQQQYLTHVVEHHRKLYPNANKTTLNKINVVNDS